MCELDLSLAFQLQGAALWNGVVVERGSQQDYSSSGDDGEAAVVNWKGQADPLVAVCCCLACGVPLQP